MFLLLLSFIFNFFIKAVCAFFENLESLKRVMFLIYLSYSDESKKTGSFLKCN